MGNRCIVMMRICLLFATWSEINKVPHCWILNYNHYDNGNYWVKIIYCRQHAPGQIKYVIQHSIT